MVPLVNAFCSLILHVVKNTEKEGFDCCC
jgi:hypothetical protein